MEHLAALLSPCVPCLCGWMTCYDSRVVWVADDAESDDSPRAVALTIDDVPRKGTTMQDVRNIMGLLKEFNARATFFVFFDQLNVSDADPRAPIVREFIKAVKAGGHELGVHFEGRWGNQMSLTELDFRIKSSLELARKRFAMDVNYLRMPGGFSNLAQVTLIKSHGLTVVNGTAYPGDADVCQCLSAFALGRCTARMANSDGRIAILHDDRRLLAKVYSFLEQMHVQRRRAITLRELLGHKHGFSRMPLVMDNTTVPTMFIPF